jgi:hypothetical protein
MFQIVRAKWAINQESELSLLRFVKLAVYKKESSSSIMDITLGSGEVAQGFISSRGQT